MKEKLQEYALVAEIISAIAIVLSLVFVGLQVMQGNAETAANTETMRSQVREFMLSSDLGMLNMALEYPQLINTGFDPEGKDEETLSRMTAWIYQFNRTRENYWVQHHNGMLDTETYLSYRATYLSLLTYNKLALEIWFDTSRVVLHPGFVAEIDALLVSEGVISEEDLNP